MFHFYKVGTKRSCFFHGPGRKIHPFTQIKETHGLHLISITKVLIESSFDDLRKQLSLMRLVQKM